MDWAGRAKAKAKAKAKAAGAAAMQAGPWDFVCARNAARAKRISAACLAPGGNAPSAALR